MNRRSEHDAEGQPPCADAFVSRISIDGSVCVCMCGETSWGAESFLLHRGAGDPRFWVTKQSQAYHSAFLPAVYQDLHDV